MKGDTRSLDSSSYKSCGAGVFLWSHCASCFASHGPKCTNPIQTQNNTIAPPGQSITTPLDSTSSKVWARNMGPYQGSMVSTLHEVAGHTRKDSKYLYNHHRVFKMEGPFLGMLIDRVLTVTWKDLYVFDFDFYV